MAIKFSEGVRNAVLDNLESTINHGSIKFMVHDEIVLTAEEYSAALAEQEQIYGGSIFTKHYVEALEHIMKNRVFPDNLIKASTKYRKEDILANVGGFYVTMERDHMHRRYRAKFNRFLGHDNNGLPMFDRMNLWYDVNDQDGRELFDIMYAIPQEVTRHTGYSFRRAMKHVFVLDKAQAIFAVREAAKRGWVPTKSDYTSGRLFQFCDWDVYYRGSSQFHMVFQPEAMLRQASQAEMQEARGIIQQGLEIQLRDALERERQRAVGTDHVTRLAAFERAQQEGNKQNILKFTSEDKEKASTLFSNAVKMKLKEREAARKLPVQTDYDEELDG